MTEPTSQRQTARAVLVAKGMVRLRELRNAGITAATVSRMVRDGEVLRLARGLYQLSDAPLNADHSLAEAAKRLPKGIVCLVSALAYHGLTDQLPKKVWLAIGNKDWVPKRGTSLRIVRFTDGLLTDSIETHVIEGVAVKIFGAAKTVADCFRHRRKVGLSVAIEGLQEALPGARPRRASSHAMPRLAASRP